MNIVPYESNQQVFEIVAKHLFNQGEQSISSGACLYRGPAGTSCAVGCLIPDELYKKDMDDWSVNPDTDAQTIVRAYSTLGQLFKSIDKRFLNNLQYIHDDERSWSSTDSMRRQLIAVGKKYNLNTEFLDNLSFIAS